MGESTERRLLRREQNDLDAIAVLLREHRRVVAFLVGEAEVRAAALTYLREKSGVEIPDPVLLKEAWQTLEALTEAASQMPREVRALLIDHREPGVLEALNLHREKLRRGAAVLVWIEGVDGLRVVQAAAPDAYSFRDRMIFIKGEELTGIQLPAEEPVEVKLARIPYGAASTPLEYAAAALNLGNLLNAHGSGREAVRVVRDALDRLSEEYSDSVSQIVRAGLLAVLSVCQIDQGQFGTAWLTNARGLCALRDNNMWEARARRLVLKSYRRTPIGISSQDVEDALQEMLPTAEQSSVSAQVLAAASSVARGRGDLSAGRELLQRAMRIAGLSSVNYATLIRAEGAMKMCAGDLRGAEESLRLAMDMLTKANSVPDLSALTLAECLITKGECGAGERILESVLSKDWSSSYPGFSAGLICAGVRAYLGDVERGLAEIRDAISRASLLLADGILYEACHAYVTCLRAAHEVARLIPEDLATAEADLNAAESVSLAIADKDPPWYTILYPGLRAELLSLRPDRISDAITLATAALERARAEWTDAAPMHARRLVTHLVRARRFDEALAAVAVAEPEAEAQRHLRELARLRSLAVVALVQTGAPPADVDARLAALRSTLDDTGAPRIAADTLLDLAILLPPAATRPDPLALLDEAQGLFADMPIPAKEARSLEAMGDFLAARGDAAGARSRYLSAKGIYERYDLGLRLPLLSTKLDGA